MLTVFAGFHDDWRFGSGDLEMTYTLAAQVHDWLTVTLWAFDVSNGECNESVHAREYITKRPSVVWLFALPLLSLIALAVRPVSLRDVPWILTPFASVPALERASCLK